MKLIVEGRIKKSDFKGSISDLLPKLGFMREEVVVKVNGKLAPDTKKVGEKDKVEIIKVVFGG